MRDAFVCPSGHAGGVFFCPAGEAMAKKRKVKAKVMDAEMMTRAVTRLAHEVLERNKGAGDVAIIGIRKRGDLIAKRIADKIKEIEGRQPLLGAVDISFYRDDVTNNPVPRAAQGSELTFDISGKVVVLVDDVLMSGRSARAALDHLVDYGRPRAVQLAVLVDRGHRELPISADYTGKNLPTSVKEEVEVKVKEADGEDAVIIYEGGVK